jgi:hypothetical protein
MTGQPEVIFGVNLLEGDKLVVHTLPEREMVRMDEVFQTEGSPLRLFAHRVMERGSQRCRDELQSRGEPMLRTFRLRTECSAHFQVFFLENIGFS